MLSRLTPLDWGFVVFVALLPNLFFLYNAARHCQRNQVPLWPALGKVFVLPGWGLAELYSTVPQRDEATRLAIAKKLSRTGHFLSVVFWVVAVTLAVA
jgi:hypothetical protein